MSRSIKELSVHYNPINERNTFTSGDIVEGRVVLEVTKEIKVDSLFVKLTGDAHVSWTEGTGQSERNTTLLYGETYGPVIKPGSHVFPFRFQLPQQ
ncbi:hypothetical protein Q8A67_003870 [Cirrhinus molitorella]|uniref:Arrestin-like N-terminal domain-containing protein n=1 Tax=Cirrhinus molitorella TaxID=172907 RepID=A0AA88QAK7_9TELE|nr:hypothetical protein Q8A67_003870 [Cirrhinus molitorella]